MGYALLAVAAICVAGSIYTIATVGKERKPNTPADAAIITCVNAAIITILVVAAFRLQGW